MKIKYVRLNRAALAPPRETINLVRSEDIDSAKFITDGVFVTMKKDKLGACRTFMIPWSNILEVEVSSDDEKPSTAKR